MKLVEIKYVDGIGGTPKSDRTYTYAAGNDVGLGQYRTAVARGKTLTAIVVAIHEDASVLETLNNLPYPLAALQVIGAIIPDEVPAPDEDCEPARILDTVPMSAAMSAEDENAKVQSSLGSFMENFK